MKKPTHILLVEDKAADAELAQRVIRKTLKNCDFQVVETRKDFLMALDTFQPDVILADYRLPQFDGMKALKLALKHAPLTPLIIWTGSISEDAAVECMKAGANNYILKENLKRLGPAIDHALEERKSLVARRQAEEKYQAIFENSVEGVFQSSPEGRYLTVNAAMARIYGYDSPKEMIESVSNIADQIYVEPNKRFEFMRLLQSQGIVENYEERNYRKDGSIIWTSTSGRAVRDENGNILYYEGFIQDVTQRKRAEGALLENEKRFRALIENGLDNISLLAADGALLWESPATTRTLNYAPNEFVGRNIFELMHPQDLEWTREIFAKLLQEPGSHQRGVFRLRHSDGTWRWVEAIATNMLNEPSVNAIVINYRDVTERKQVEEALRESQIKYQNLVETSHDLIWSVDAEGKITFLNRAAQEIYGYEPEELIGRSFFEILDPQYYRAVDLEMFRAGLAYADEFKNTETYVRHRDGRQLILSSNSIVLRDENGKVIGVTGSAHDITEHKRAEEVLKEERNLLRTLIDNLPDRIFVIDTQGRKTISNTADWKASGGTKMEDVINKTVFDTYPPELAEQFRKLDKEIIDSGKPVINYEEPGLDTEGNQVSILTTKVPLRDSEGKVIGLVGIGRDITERKQVEDRISDLLAFNEKILNHSPIGILTYKLTGECIFANEKAASIVGTQVEHLMAQNFHLIESWKKSDLYDLVESAIVTQEAVTADIHHVSTFGKDVWMTAHCMTFKSKDETQVLLSIIDITERKQAEEKLRHSENRYRLATKATNDVIWEANLQTNQLFWSENAQSVFGYASEEIDPPETWWDDHLHPDDRERVLSKLNGLIGEDESIWSEEYRFLRKDGSYAHVSDRGYIERDANGTPLRMIGAMTDITERKRAEEALRESENRLILALSGAQMSVWEWSLQTNSILWSPEFFEIAGVKEDEFGKTFEAFTNLVHEEDVDRLMAAAEKAVSDKTLFAEEFRIIRTDGETRWLSNLGHAEYDSTKDHLRLIGTVQDITQRKQAEIERQTLLEIMQGFANTKDLPELLRLIHRSIARVIYAENFFVVMYQPDSGLFEEIYSVDQYDPPAPPAKLEKSITSYIFRSGEPILLTQALFDELAAQGEVELVGTNSASWLGVPLKIADRTIGVIAVQDYENSNRYSERDKDFMASIATQIALAIEHREAGIALRESEKRFRALIENSIDAIALVQADGKITYVTPGIFAVLGYSVDEFLGRNGFEFVHPEDAERAASIFAELLQKPGLTVATLMRERHKDGSWRWLEGSVTNLLTEPSVGALVANFHDVTERKRAEDAEREQRALAEALRYTAETLSRTLDYGEVLDHILTAVGRVVPHEAASILLIDGEVARVARTQGYIERGFDVSGVKLPLNEENNLRKMLETRQPVIVYDTVSYPGWNQLPSTEWLRSNVGAPISIYGEVIGFIILDSDKLGFFTPVHAERLEAFADQAALAIHNARLLQRAQEEIAERKQAEMALTESNAKFRTLFEASPDAIVLIDQREGWPILDCNTAACQMNGYTRQELIGQPIDILNVEPSTPEGRAGYLEQIRQAGVFHQESAHRRKDGTIFPVDISTSLITLSGHKVILGIDRDITERKRAEQALIESMAQFRTLFEASPEAIMLLDPSDNWSIVDCNTAGCQMNGYHREELIGQSIDILNLTPGTAQERAAYMERVRQHGILRYETAHRRKDGAIIEVEVSTSLIKFGTREIVLGIDRDITERKKAEAALRESEEKIQNIISHSSSMFYTHTTDHVLTYVSPQSHYILDCEPEEAMIHWQQWLSDYPTNIQGIKATERAIQTGQRQPPYELELITRQGRRIWVQVDESPVVAEGKTVAIVGSLTDITERKRSEEEIQQRAEETSALLQTSLALTSLDLESTLQTIGNSAKTLFAADGCRIFLMDPDSETLQCVLALQENSVAFSNLRIKVGDGVTGAVAASGRAEIVNKMQDDARAVQVPGTEEREEEAIMFAPLKERERTIGVLSIRRAGSERPFQPSNLEFLEAFASMAASAVSNARLFEETEQRLAELRASEERFRQLADNIQEVFWMTDAETSREIYMSPAAEMIWGRSVESLMHEPDAFLNSIFPEDQSMVLEAIEKEKNGEKVEMEYRIVQPNGSLRWVWDRAFPIFDDSGKVKRIAGISADITERRQIEQELRKLSRAVEQSASTIVITDTAANIEYVNPKFTEITGYTVDEVLGKNPRILKSGLTAKQNYEQLWQAITSGNEWHGELLNRKKNGELFWEYATISPILNDAGETTHFLAVKEDITQRKQSEMETRRHMAELEAVYDNGLAVGHLLKPSEIGERVIKTFGCYLPWHHVTIRLRREESDDLELVAFNLPHLTDEEKAGTEQHFISLINKVGQGLSGWVIQTGKPLRTGNVHAHPQYVDAYPAIHSGMYMPLQIGERVIGVISVESETPDAFTEQDQRLLATLANQTAIAFENARLYEAIQKELSERKRAEEALRFSETHYRELADSITDILFELDQNLYYTHWNKASEMLTGIPVGDAIGKSMYEIFGETEEQRRISQIYEDVLKTRQPRTIETKMPLNGEKRSFEINAYPSTRGVSVVAKDVTDRKRSEIIMQKRFELMEYSAHHSLIEVMQKTTDEVSDLTGSTIGFFHFVEADQNTLGMQTWSTNALRLFNVPASEGTHLALDQAGVWAEAVRQRRSLIQNDYQSLATKKDLPQGHVPLVREMVIPIIRSERIVAVMGIGNKPQEYGPYDLEIAERLADYAWDITERKQMELALENERNQLAQRVAERTADLSQANSNLARALRVKDEFLANMSHELRTPLNAILGLSESLGEQIAGPLNEKQQKYITTISESGHHLLSLINDILDLAKIEAGQITLDINKVDIRSVCQASLRMTKQLAQKKNQEVSLQINEGLGLMWADERRLKQMIVNLLGNAVKFTPENGKIGLEVHGDQDANKVTITVWDSGIGIKEGDLERLFKPFVQLDSGLAREATGTGLGLALVAQMARLHGGSVHVASEPEKGSRFSIQLPWEPALAVDTASRLRVTGKFRAIKPEEKNKPTILLVEDTKEVVMMLRDYLELAGYKIVTAQDGVDAIVQAKLVRPDLILMDIQMPRMDGFEATRKLRSEPDFRYTPIIALTALAMPNDRERCLAAGMDEYISKPVNLKALVKIIQSCLYAEESKSR